MSDPFRPMAEEDGWRLDTSTGRETWHRGSERRPTSFDCLDPLHFVNAAIALGVAGWQYSAPMINGARYHFWKFGHDQGVSSLDYFVATALARKRMEEMGQ